MREIRARRAMLAGVLEVSVKFGRLDRTALDFGPVRMGVGVMSPFPKFLDPPLYIDKHWSYLAQYTFFVLRHSGHAPLYIFSIGLRHSYCPMEKLRII